MSGSRVKKLKKQYNALMSFERQNITWRQFKRNFKNRG